MQHQTIAIFLPILRQENIQLEWLSASNIKYLWPGLAAKPNNYWQPESYVFDAQEAQTCLNDLDNMGHAAISGVPVHAIIGIQDQGAKLKDFKEQDLLANFANTGQATESAEIHELYVKKAAQKFLLWAWLLEERFYEIQNLTKKYAHGAKHLFDSLGIEKDDALSTIQNIESSMQIDDAFLPPWQLILENAAVFLPDNCKVVVNDERMLSHVLDMNLSLTPLTQENMQSLDMQNTNIYAKECTITVGDILQKTKRKMQDTPWLNKNLQLILLEHNNV